jgi:cyclase
VNTAAFKNRQLINDLASEFGSQCIVLAIDTKLEEDGQWYVYLNGGRTKTNMLCFDWARHGVLLGAGEILLTSMNHDGTKKGFALDITKQLAENLSVPVIASGGGGTMQHFADVFKNSNADACTGCEYFSFQRNRYS